jgi:hypothetical protein
MRTIQWAAEIATQTQDPTVMDWFNTDAIVPELMQVNGAPFRYIRDPKEVEQMRQGRKAAQEQQQLLQSMPGMAQMMKATNPEGTSPNAGQPT